MLKLSVELELFRVNLFGILLGAELRVELATILFQNVIYNRHTLAVLRVETSIAIEFFRNAQEWQ